MTQLQNISASTDENINALLLCSRMPASCEGKLHFTGTGPINLRLFLHRSSLDNGCSAQSQSTAKEGDFPLISHQHFKFRDGLQRKTGKVFTHLAADRLVKDFDASGRITERVTKIQFIEFSFKRCGEKNNIRLNKIHSCFRYVVTAGYYLGSTSQKTPGTTVRQIISYLAMI